MWFGRKIPLLSLVSALWRNVWSDAGVDLESYYLISENSDSSTQLDEGSSAHAI